jgi:hypothetical protein
MGGFAAGFKALLGGNPIDGISKIIEEFHLSPEQKAQMQAAVQAQEIDLEKAKLARDAALQEVAGQNIRSETGSADKYTSRARPTFMYIVEGILFWNFILLPSAQFITGKPPAPIVLPTDLLWLFGSCVMGYVGARSLDKFMGLPGDSQMKLPFGIQLGNKGPDPAAEKK